MVDRSYTRGAEVWKAFGLRDHLRRLLAFMPINPPHTKGRRASAWGVFFLLTLLLLTTMFLVGIAAPREEVFRQKYTFCSGTANLRL